MSQATMFINVSPVDESAPGRISPVSSAPKLSSMVAAASDMVPMLRQRAQATEEARRVSEDTIDAFRKAGFFKLMQPSRYGGSDIALLSMAGVPVVQVGQDVSRYFDWHHSADDTLDKIDRSQLNQAVATWAAFLYIAANADIDFRPQPTPAPPSATPH